MAKQNPSNRSNPLYVLSNKDGVRRKKRKRKERKEGSVSDERKRKTVDESKLKLRQVFPKATK